MVLSPGAGIANAAGGLSFWSPACPAFSLLFCPPSPKGKDIPPTPFPGGEGGDSRLFHARGFAPCIPGTEPARHWERGRTTRPAGVCLVCRPPTPPLVYFFAPIPPTPFPGGEGGDSKIILPGASPPAPRHLTVCGTYRPCHTGAGRRWDEASPAPSGACPRRCRLTLPLWYSQGGAPSLSPACPAFCFPFCPPSPEGKDRPPGKGGREPVP